ncbi:MAG: hypothetical protein WC692_03345 [Erythrobacter sp.]|jgi:hypothetical protein
MGDALDKEIQRNLFAFLPKLPELLPEHEGSYALLRNQQIQGIHVKLSDALKVAYERFADGLFSIQRVTVRPQELGMFSSAENQG